MEHSIFLDYELCWVGTQIYFELIKNYEPQWGICITFRGWFHRGNFVIYSLLVLIGIYCLENDKLMYTWQDMKWTTYNNFKVFTFRGDTLHTCYEICNYRFKVSLDSQVWRFDLKNLFMKYLKNQVFLSSYSISRIVQSMN